MNFDFLMGTISKAHTRRIIFWTILFTIVNLSVKSAYILLPLFLASILTPEAYANFGVLYSLKGAMTTFSLVGLAETTVARLKEYPSGLRREVLFRRTSSLFIFTSLLTFLCLIPLLLYASRTNISPWAAVFALLLGAVMSYGVLQSDFHRIEEHHKTSLVSSAGISLGAITGLAIGGIIFQSLTLVFALGFIGASTVILFLVISGKVFVGSTPRFSRVYKDSQGLLPFVGIAIFGWLSGYGMNFLIDAQFKPFYVATFTFLFTFASVSQIIVSSLNMVWAPRFYNLFNAGDSIQAESGNRFFLTILAITLGLCGNFAVALLPWITKIIGGNLENYGHYQIELAFLISGYVVAIPWWHGQNYYFVSGYTSDLMNLSLWSGGIGLVSWLLCMIILGPTGIFFGFPVQMAIKSGAMWFYGNQHWQLRPPWMAMAIGCLMIFSGLLTPTPY